MKKIFQVLTAATLLTSTATFAATFSCTVDINHLLINSTGAVNVKHTGRGEYTHICNLTTERQGVSITTCAMWTSMLLNLKQLNKQAIFSYDTAVTPTSATSCATLPIYDGAPAPALVGAP